MVASSAIPDLTGRVIKDGQYQLTQKLGSGAYGVVYRAIDFAFSCSSSPSKTSPRQAIKVLRKEGLSSSAATRVRREITAHRRMSDHPNVVSMLDAFEDKDYVYIVLDYCPGGDLFGKIVDEQLYFRNDELAKSVFLQILDAVETCHRKLIYHRDLKPENILTNEDGTKVYLTDFGLATGNQVSETFGCGSAPYMSPECVGKEAGFLPYSNRANDIWALGVILINMITCRSPWSKALTTDDCFREFLLYETYLREMLPISKGADRILRQIFAYEASERMTIPALRKAILDLDTFFMTDVEIAYASDAVRIAASSCGVHVQAAEKLTVAPVLKGAATPRTPLQLECTTSASLEAVSNAVVVDVSAGESGPDSASYNSSSAPESNGPRTPSMQSQDPALAVPEFRLELSDFVEQPVSVVKAPEDVIPRGGIITVVSV